jgi:hypothetical protein
MSRCYHYLFSENKTSKSAELTYKIKKAIHDMENIKMKT